MPLRMRRRVIWMFLVCFAAMGCQSQRPAVVERPDLGPAADVEYEAVTASALVFDPPVIAGEEPLELSRADRAPGAFVGYDGPIVEHFYIRMDDSQIGYGSAGGGGFGRGGRRWGGGGNSDRYERRAITERIGVRYR
jgi:uncharacterized membrane protein YgcG